MTRDEFGSQFSQALLVDDDADVFDEFGVRTDAATAKSKRPDGRWQLAEITLTNGMRFITRVPDPVTLDDLPSLPPVEQTRPEFDDDMPEFLKVLATRAHDEAREQAADQLYGATKADSMQRITACINASARTSGGWFDVFTADAAEQLVTIAEHNIAVIRLLADHEADQYPRARNGG